MKLSSLLSKDLITVNLRAQTKKEAFEELVELVCDQNKKLDREKVLNSVLEREKQQSTYLGKGLSMPHARIEGLNDFMLVCGQSQSGIMYPETKDKVHHIVLILSCKTKINMLLQTMGAFATFFSDDALSLKLKNASSPDEFIRVIDESNIKVKQTIVARDIMQSDVILLYPDQTLKEVIDLFFEKNVSGAPVLNPDGTILGVVTEKDLISVGIPKYMSMMDNISFLNEFEPFEEIFKKEDNILVRDILCTDFTFVHEEVSVIQLAFYFVNKNCRRIMVTDDSGKLIGIIMRKDLIRKVIHA
jgi:PTS system nitrogen regulatory IIA component